MVALKIIAFFCVVVNVWAQDVTMEPPCARVGGQCMIASDCPEQLLSSKTGLCPLQQSLGVECCFGVSIRERRCSKRGGQCLPKTRCGRQLWDDRAEDCGRDETCCILV